MVININMTALSRITDIGIGGCPVENHGQYSTTFITGANTVFTNNLNQTVITTLGVQDACGNALSTAITGSSTVFAEFLPVHRIGDVGVGHAGDIYTSVTGSPNVFNDI